MRLRTRIALTLLPPEVWSDVRNELALRRSVLLSRVRRSHSPGCTSGPRLHLGCGRRVIAGWVNIDAIDAPGVDLVWDIRQRLPFASGSAELIYTEHVLEHLVKTDADHLLAECFRVLIPSGLLRVGVPDAELYLRAYVGANQEFFARAAYLGGATRPLRTRMEVINQMFRMGGAHKYAWDFETLNLSLTEIGFKNVVRYESGRASVPDLCLDDPAHSFETLYAEALKPC
jgi:predicted SAM-dependent methyltransferase